ncbi:hypothetical protein KEM48_010232 [Puccinia striiformis f. sp. tritici PST-130]|nr:hypothetical protein KEM48_010232 [Puccinia striiformis f. sp. tritici PST-130]
MGKRVNCATRSVISPDINIETNEIGVPPVSAKMMVISSSSIGNQPSINRDVSPRKDFDSSSENGRWSHSQSVDTCDPCILFSPHDSGMNMPLPQSSVAQSEARMIANNNNQYWYRPRPG